MMSSFPDQVILPKMCFTVCHGVLEKEKQEPQNFQVIVTMDTDLRKAGETDSLEDTIDYSKVYRQVAEIMTGPCCNLLEHLSEKICKMILTNEKVIRVKVEIMKEAADMGDAKVPSMVRIVRERQSL